MLNAKNIISVVLASFLFIGAAGAADEVKKEDLAGRWYPADKQTLAAKLDWFIAQAVLPKIDVRVLGMISPHAGYDYSGRTAGYGFRAIQAAGYKTVVILGFSHRNLFDGVSVYDRGGFETPLGVAPVDADFAGKLTGYDPRISFQPELFKDENSVELIIPFVQAALPEARIVPAAFGSQDYALCEVMAKALAAAVGDRDDVLIIASTDMSHFHPYDEANRIDNFTIKKLKEFKPRELFAEVRLGASELCGAAPVITLMLAMQALGADNIRVLKYENSGDTTGDKTKVVGYVSAICYRPFGKKEADENMLNEAQRKRLLEIARKTVEEYVKMGTAPEFTETDPELAKEMGAFVTLHYKGDLRGCIGNIIGRGPLYRTVRDMAVEASANDPRFAPVTPRELPDIKIEISVLSEPKRVTDVNKIVMGRDGVIIKKGLRSGVFLPQVATETGWGREEFLSNLCAHKAGLPANAWQDPATEIYSFTAEVFGEE